MCRLSSKRTGIGQCSSTTVTEKPIVSNEFYVMSLMALLNAVHAYGIAVRGITGVTSVEVMHRIAGVTGYLI